MKRLALDLGTRHTGVAFCDDAIGVPLPLKTLRHTSDDELVALVLALAHERGAEEIIVGLPLLPGGGEGSQSRFARGIGARIAAFGLSVSFVDERYTTPKSTDLDGDAAAALTLLQIILDKS